MNTDQPVNFVKKRRVIISIVLLFVFFAIFCLRTVEAGQVGVVTRFGEVNREVNSGLVVKLPWPVERLQKLDTRIQKQQEEATAATADLQDVQATLALNYALDRTAALKVFKTIGPEYRDRIIVPTVQESFKAATAQYTAAELLTKRAEVKGKALDAIKKRLQPYGVSIEDLNIVNFSFSDEFAKAIEQKQVAAQEAERAKFNLDRAKLDAEAQEVQKASLSPEFLQKLAIEKWDGHMPQYVGGNDAVFNIPLH
ncbi:MAG TPA: prohibitin family protein [Candidatus Saccharimonadales bacterium]|nr:prohibitin family protein [Candidatus Saccharimonadales bacterium]